MSINRRTLLAAGAALPLLGRAGHAARTPGTITVGVSGYPPSLAPWVYTAQPTVKLLIHRSLLSYSVDGELQGELAESYAADGNSAWVFKLRSAFFHNGAPVTAEDVKWSIEQVMAEKSTAHFKGDFEAIQAVETPDAKTVRIVTKRPVVTLPLWFANVSMPIIARGTAENPVGAGPYMIKNAERGVSLDLEAFDRYYKPGLPKTKRLKLIVYSDESLRVAALQAGDVDLIDYVPHQSMQTIENDPKLKLDVGNGSFLGLLFNGSQGPFSDVRVRQAVAFAVRRDEIVKAALMGRGAILEGIPLSPQSPYWNEARSKYWRYDLDRAKALLAEAGVPSGFKCRLMSLAQFSMYTSTSEILQQHLAAVGIDVTIDLPDFPTRVQLGNRGQFQFAVTGGATDVPDPDGLTRILDATLPPSFTRSYGIKADRLHQLLDEGRAEFDPARRREIYARMEEEALKEAVNVGLVWRQQGYAMTREVQGFKNMPGPLTLYSGMMLEHTSVA